MKTPVTFKCSKEYKGFFVKVKLTQWMGNFGKGHWICVIETGIGQLIQADQSTGAQWDEFNQESFEKHIDNTFHRGLGHLDDMIRDSLEDLQKEANGH